MESQSLHIAMYPWFAMGHLTSYLHISNKLAARGHKISVIMPKNTQPKFDPFNFHKDLITFIPVSVPSVDGLPPGSETTTDVPSPLHSLLMTAMDLTEPVIEAILCKIKPHVVFFDFTHWMPSLGSKLGIKSLVFVTISPATVGYLLSPERKLRDKMLTEADLLQPPHGFPPSKIKLRAHEARGLVAATIKDFGGVSFMERISVCLTEGDAIGFKTCREIEGPYCDYIERQFEKRVILAGPVLPQPPSSVLEEQLENFLDSFQGKSLIFCAFGSECVLKKEQFQELLLGFEATGLPFFAALKPPMGHENETMESSLPEGFEERVKGRGFVHGGWVQQQLILKHPCVGCFVTHCGSGSLSEAMVNECRLVLLPNVGDQIINARLMGEDLRVGVEVERGDEDGLFTRNGVCKAVKAVMDDDSEVGAEVMQNRAKLRAFLRKPGLDDSYVDGFVQELHTLVELN